MIYPTKYGINVSVEIIREADTDTAFVKVHAPLYIRKEWVMTFCYKSSIFSDCKILMDSSFQNEMIRSYGDRYER